MNVSDAPLEAILVHVRDERGFDFTGYKRASLERRVSRRVDALGLRGVDQYLDHLQVHPEEFRLLFDTILINVTEFMRDIDAWTFLAEDVIPRLLAARAPDAPIRLWSAGCATGEEPYSLAMLFAEALGVEEFVHRVKIYATDVDEAALSLARQATYTPSAVRNVPPDLLDRYFVPAPAASPSARTCDAR